VSFRFLTIGVLVALPVAVFAQLNGIPLSDDSNNKKNYSHNILRVDIDASDTIRINGVVSSLDSLAIWVKKHITNNGRDSSFSDSPQRAIVSLKCRRQTSYKRYVDVYNTIKAAYWEVRNTTSKEMFNLDYDVLDEQKKKQIRQEIPMRIAEAEPTEK
jgi:hypothetical protein